MQRNQSDTVSCIGSILFHKTYRFVPKYSDLSSPPKAFNMPGKKRPAIDDGDSSDDEINMNQVIKTKAELDKVLLPVYCLGHQR